MIKQAISKALPKDPLESRWFHHQVLSAPREGRTRLQVSHRVTVYSHTDHWYPTFRLNCSFFQKTFTELHFQYTSVSHVPSAKKVIKARLNPKAHCFLSLQFPHPRAWQAWPSATQETLWLWQHQVLKPPSTNYSNSRGMHEFPQPSLKHKLRLSELVTETLKKKLFKNIILYLVWIKIIKRETQVIKASCTTKSH